MNIPAVFIDRDGVINAYVYNRDFGTVDSPNNPGEFALNPGVPEAIGALRSMGFLTIVVSNQPGIAKGKYSPEILAAVTSKMREECGHNIDDVFYCLHHPDAAHPDYGISCLCRKPKPGLLLEACAKWKIDMANSFLVGDGISDIVAGHAAGVRTILVNARRCYICEELARFKVSADFFATDLPRAVEIIRAQLGRNSNQTRSRTWQPLPHNTLKNALEC